LSQYLYWQSTTKTCYHYTRGGGADDYTSRLDHIISDSAKCPSSGTCTGGDFVVAKYKDAKHFVKLSAFEKCELRVYHKINYDKSVQTEPTFKVSTSSSQYDVRYSYYDPFDFSRSYYLTTGQLVKTSQYVVIQIVNSGHIEKNYEIRAKMQTVSTCVTLDATNCLDCVASGSGHYFSAETNVCYQPPHPPLFGFDGAAKKYQDCPETTKCGPLEINFGGEKDLSYKLTDGGVCYLKVTNKLTEKVTLASKRSVNSISYYSPPSDKYKLELYQTSHIHGNENKNWGTQQITLQSGETIWFALMNTGDEDESYDFHVAGPKTASVTSTLLGSSQMSTILDTIGSFGKQVKNYESCFNTAQHGFASTTMHPQCDNPSGNKWGHLVIVKATNGRVFGGYSEKGYRRNAGYQSDSHGFLFNVQTSGSVGIAKSKGDSYTTYSTDGYGPTFGGGHDLYVPNNCNSNQGYTNSGYSF
jgi:hypothetical protein